jgi:serine/threonine protein kinase
LGYAHARGVVYGDIKPSNLLLDAAGVVWVTDFGLATRADSAMTHSGDILGTRAVLDFVETKAFAAARPAGQEGGLGRDVTLRQAIEAAMPHIGGRFSNQPLIEARQRQTLGLSVLYLGEARTATEQFDKARALYAKYRGPDHPDTLMSMNHLAYSYSNDC